MKPRLKNTRLVQSLARLEQSADKTDKYAGLPPGGLRGTIVDVNDPEKRGRVRVVFDDMNPDIPQVTGAGDWSKSREGLDPDKSHWIDTSPAFKGKQPSGLVGKRVNIAASNGQYQYAVLNDVMYDPQLLSTDKQGSLEMPNNSSMTRLPVYPSGKLPPPCKDNHGCMVIEENGPMDCDWMCVCLKRKGGYMWVRHVDLAHGHAGQNDDDDDEVTGPDCENSVWDFVFPTTHCVMEKKTKCGNPCPPPRPNPFGDEAKWYPPPFSEDGCNADDPPPCDAPCSQPLKGCSC